MLNEICTVNTETANIEGFLYSYNEFDKFFCFPDFVKSSFLDNYPGFQIDFFLAIILASMELEIGLQFTFAQSIMISRFLYWNDSLVDIFTASNVIF